jgi:hypothetical protein
VLHFQIGQQIPQIENPPEAEFGRALRGKTRHLVQGHRTQMLLPDFAMHYGKIAMATPLRIYRALVGADRCQLRSRVFQTKKMKTATNPITISIQFWPSKPRIVK